MRPLHATTGAWREPVIPLGLLVGTVSEAFVPVGALHEPASPGTSARTDS